MKKSLSKYALVFIAIIISSCTANKTSSSLITDNYVPKNAPSSISQRSSNSQSAPDNSLSNVQAPDSTNLDVIDRKSVPIVHPDIQGNILAVDLQKCEFTINVIDNSSGEEFDIVILTKNEVVIKYDESTNFIYTTSNNTSKTTQTVAGNIDNIKIGLHSKIKGKIQNGSWIASEIEIAQSIN